MHFKMKISKKNCMSVHFSIEYLKYCGILLSDIGL